MADDKYLPLMLGSRPIGVIKFDLETGDISGKLEDPGLAELLNACFANGLMEVSFFAKPTVPMPEAQEQVKKFMKGGFYS